MKCNFHNMKCLFYCFIFKIHQAGHIEHISGPVLACGTYVWHPKLSTKDRDGVGEAQWSVDADRTLYWCSLQFWILVTFDLSNHDDNFHCLYASGCLYDERRENSPVNQVCWSLVKNCVFLLSGFILVKKRISSDWFLGWCGVKKKKIKKKLKNVHESDASCVEGSFVITAL